MDPLLNPFSPGAGAPPPELVGREPILRQSEILFGRIARGRAEKSMLLTGLRGVGKTVLLNEIGSRGEKEGFQILLLEAHEGKALGPLIAPSVRELLYRLDRVAGSGEKVKRGLRVLRSFLGALKLTYGDVSIGLDIDPETGTADTGDIEIDLPNLFVSVGEAARERQTLVALLIDEIQYFSPKELGALIMAMHRLQQRQLPFVLIGAGLPILPALAGEAKSYAERLFDFPPVGPLEREESFRALREPTKECGVDFDEPALEAVWNETKGYPYFLQEWGYHAWNLGENNSILQDTVLQAEKTVIIRLDEGFFRVRFDRLTPREKEYLRAMATLGPGPHRAGDVAALLGKEITSLGPLRAKLIQKGMVYSPAHGEVGFTVPLFDEFMKRAIPDS